MSWKAVFVFRILLGAVFIAQFLFGFDGRGHGTGNIMFLILGILFGGYGIYGLIQRAALRKKLAAKYGLAATASWQEIGQAATQQQQKNTPQA